MGITTNEGKDVVTNGTKHVAQNTSADDMCLDADNTKTVKPYKNYIPSTDLKTGYTVNTLIAQKNIMTLNTIIGPPSKGNDALWELGNTSGKPVFNKVWATKGSSDVKAEGHWINRTDDPTKQNGGNSSGIIDGSLLDGDELTIPDNGNKKCSMMTLEGTSGSRQLWKRSENSEQYNYIEILDGKTVDFISTRYDATDITGDPTLDPPCEINPRHTRWKIKRTGAGLNLRDRHSGKTYTLGWAMTNFLGSLEVSGGDSSESTTAGGVTESGNLRTDNTKKSYAVSADIGALIALLRFWVNPVYVNVDAIACSGAKRGVVRIFPADPFKFKVELQKETNKTTKVGSGPKNALIDSLRNKFSKLKSLINKISGIVGIADVELIFSLFVGFYIELEVGYKECEKTLTTRAGDWRSAQAHVGLYYQLKVGADKLIEFGVSVSISVLALVATFFGPGALTQAVRKLEDFIGGKPLALVFSASIAVGFDLEFKYDQHEEGSASGNIAVKPEVSLMLKLEVGNASASAGGKLKGEIKFSTAQAKPTHFGRIVTSGKIEVIAWVEGSIKGRVLWIGPSFEIGAKKEFELFKYEAKEIGSWDIYEKGKRAP